MNIFKTIVTKIKIYWPIIALILFYSLFFFKTINLPTSDLGRHITNGSQIIQNGSVAFEKIFTTNYYSFTQPEFKFINHHWFFGVIVYVVHSFFSFEGLTLLSIFLNSLVLFILLLKTIQLLKHDELITLNQTTQITLVSVLGFLLLPLFTSRTEVRPETISLLFFAVYFFVFDWFSRPQFHQRSLTSKILHIVPLLFVQIIWVNTHLFFIFGPLLAGYYLFEKTLSLLFQKKALNEKMQEIFKSTSLRFWLLLTFLFSIVSSINPNGVQGLLAPLNIFDNYAYRVAENQSSIFMIEYGSQVPYYSFVIAISIIILLSFFALFLKKQKNNGETLAQIILVIIFVVLGNKINRMSPFLALIAFPFFVKNVVIFVEKIWGKISKYSQNTVFTLFATTVISITIILLLKIGIFLPRIEIFGLGLVSQTQNSAHFFLENKLEGPIFNNYDIGGYLIYSLFPKEKMYLDNRPEAYSGEFITNEYLLALTDETVWKTMSDKYNLNVIYFYRLDQMTGTQEFLYRRVIDPEWIPVYVDSQTLIFVKNTDKNQKIISQFQIPNEIFAVGKQ